MAVFKCSGTQQFNDDGEPLCDYQDTRYWLGRCPGCGRRAKVIKYAGADGLAAARRRATLAAAPAVEAVPRVLCGVEAFDDLTHGGLPEGSTVIISGPAGAGKTTLNLMLANGAAQNNKRPVLYASAEESNSQLFEKAQRLGASSERVEVMGSEGNLHTILHRAEEMRPSLLIIDSVQEVFLGRDSSGTNQLVEALRLIKKVSAKEKIASLVVSHVSRTSGEVRGPTTMDHIVDAMLEFDPPKDLGRTERDEMERKGYRRLKLAMKSRIGPSGARYFNMTEEGIITPIDEETYFGRKRKRRRAFAEDYAEPPEPSPDAWKNSRVRIVKTDDEKTEPDAS